MHSTADDTPKNTDIKPSTNTAPPIYRFLAQKKLKKHTTKGKLEVKIRSEKGIQETVQAYTQKHINSDCKPEANLTSGDHREKIPESQFFKIKK